MRARENPPNPYHGQHVEWLGEPPEAELEVYEEEARSALTKNDSPDLPFTWSLNPYRGCQHACAYCYARPTHQYLDFGAGTDFERRLVVKINAPELLARELARPSWRRESVALSGITDCYQPLEASYELTLRCLQVLHARHTPVAIVTKSALVRRDAELLARIEQRAGARVFVSIPFADEDQARALEPGVPTPKMRLETVRVLAEAGVPVGVSIAPIIPGLNESQIAPIAEAAAAAGARFAFPTLLRLPAEVAPVFEQRLRAALPGYADKVLSAVRDVRGGKLNESRFGQRMGGVGPRWELIRQMFELACRRNGLDCSAEGGRTPAASSIQAVQGELFDDGMQP